MVSFRTMLHWSTLESLMLDIFTRAGSKRDWKKSTNCSFQKKKVYIMSYSAQRIWSDWFIYFSWLLFKWWSGKDWWLSKVPWRLVIKKVQNSTILHTRQQWLGETWIIFELTKIHPIAHPHGRAMTYFGEIDHVIIGLYWTWAPPTWTLTWL